MSYTCQNWSSAVNFIHELNKCATALPAICLNHPVTSEGYRSCTTIQVGEYLLNNLWVFLPQENGHHTFSRLGPFLADCCYTCR